MGRGTFRSQNKVGETMSFQTDSSSTTTFDPTVTFLSGSEANHFYRKANYLFLEVQR